VQGAVASLSEHLFPTLTAAQMARMAAHGRRRPMADGDVLVEVGDRSVPIFVVVSGEIQVLRPQRDGDTLVVVHRAGQFSGEGSTVEGRPAINRLRAGAAGEVIEILFGAPDRTARNRVIEVAIDSPDPSLEPADVLHQTTPNRTTRVLQPIPLRGQHVQQLSAARHQRV
jgi:CRP-like cAMP-binding protein